MMFEGNEEESVFINEMVKYLSEVNVEDLVSHVKYKELRKVMDSLVRQLYKGCAITHGKMSYNIIMTCNV